MFRDYEEAYDWAVAELEDLLSTMEDDELIELSINANASPEIIPMNELDEYFRGWSYADLLGNLAPGFSIADAYFYMNKDDMYQSFDSLAEVDFVIDIDGIIHDIIHDMDDFGNAGVADILGRMGD